MSVPPSPPRRVQVFSFPSGDALARTAQGHRLLAEAEGDGILEVWDGPTDLRVTDGSGPTSPGRFRDWMEVSAESSGPFRGAVIQGDGLPELDAERTAESFAGPSVILGPAPPVCRTGEYPLPAALPEGEFPAWLGFRAEAPVRHRPMRLDWTLEREWGCAEIKARNMSRVEDLPPHGDHAYFLTRFGVDVSLSDLDGDDILAWTGSHDRFHGRQRARVLVDGQPVGVWLRPHQNRSERWGTDLFLISGADLPGPDFRLELDPPAGTPLFGLGRLRLLRGRRRSLPAG
ncbi:MAG: hypothetical protein MH204_00370 [Fimbriimonadaceae bacterium]|nr:hypothetical protein [Fimbriimonadaceae bacterium]